MSLFRLNLLTLFIGILQATILGIIAFPAQGYALDLKKYMEVSEVRPGMKGYGLTVFQGNKVEKFKIEVISILRKVGPHQDVILVRATHPYLEKTGIIAGMSGSPVYVNDRLIGAMAFTWGFSEEAIGGVTPIAEMLRMLEEKVGPAQTGQPVTQSRPGRGADPFWAALDPLDDKYREKIRHSPLTEALEMRPVRTPVSLMGFPEFARRRLNERLGNDDLLFVPGGGAGEAEAADAGEAAFLPGGSIGVELVRGDMSAAAVGTVTEVIGDRVLGFGHPMFGHGHVHLPMAVGYIHGVMPSQMMSFKFGSALKSLGQITLDRSAGIVGKIGPLPPMVAIEVDLDWATEQKKEHFEFQVMEHPWMTSILTEAVVSGAILARGDLARDTTISVDATFELEGHVPLKVSNVYSASSSWQSLEGALDGIRRPILRTMNNEFQRFPVRQVTVKAAIEEVRRTAEVLSVTPSMREVSPGETFQIVAMVRPFQEEAQYLSFAVTVADTVAEGMAWVTVADASARRQFEQQERPHRLQPQDLAQYFEWLTRPEDHRNLYIRLTPSGGGLAIQGVELPSLPASVLAAIRHPSLSGPTPVKEVIESQHLTPWVVECRHRFPITIRRR